MCDESMCTSCDVNECELNSETLTGASVSDIKIGVPTGDSVDPILDQLSDEPPTPEEVNYAKTKLKSLQEYLNSKKFISDCNKASKKTGLSPKKVATTYIGKIGGVIGDTLGVAVDTINLGAVGLINLIDTVLTSAVNLICNIVRGIIAFLTFNRTNKVSLA